MSHTWDFYLCYLSLRPTGKRMALKYMHCWSLFWHAQFPSFIYHVMRCYQTSPGCLFLLKMVLFFEHHFKWSETFECVSYESSIATSTTTLLPSVINIRRWVLYYTPRITVEKLHFQHFLWRASPYPRALCSSPAYERSKLFCFTSWIITKILRISESRNTVKTRHQLIIMTNVLSLPWSGSINDNMFSVNSSKQVRVYTRRVYNFSMSGMLFSGAASFKLFFQVKPLKGKD